MWQANVQGVPARPSHAFNWDGSAFTASGKIKIDVDAVTDSGPSPLPGPTATAGGGSPRTCSCHRTTHPGFGYDRPRNARHNGRARHRNVRRNGNESIYVRQTLDRQDPVSRGTLVLPKHLVERTYPCR